MFTNNAQVGIIEAEDTDYQYKTITAVGTTGSVQKKWQILRAKRAREVLPSFSDLITGTQRGLPVTHTLDQKRL